MSPVGLGAGGAIGVALETAAAPGTFVAPTVWVPVTSETFNYQEERYFSEAIRQLTINQMAKQGYYNIEGDISMEVDTRLLPYFMYASRLGAVKVGAATPWTYTFSPTSGAIIPATNRTMSIAILRNGVWFGYSGCVVTSIEFTIDTGVMRANLHVIGLSDVPAGTVGSPTPAFTAPTLLGANAHTISVGDNALLTPVAGAIAMTGATVDPTWNGYTFTINDNGAAQHRINASRAAAYISMGVTEAQVVSNLDFLTRAEYDKFVATAQKRVQCLSTNGANDTMALNVYNSVYEAYNVDLGAWGDIVMADSTFHVIASGGANPPLDVTIVSTASIVVT